MATMTIEVDDDIQHLIEQRVESDETGTAGNYVRDAVLRDNRNLLPPEDPALEALLLDRVRNGNFIPVTDQLWQDIRDRLEEKIRQRRRERSSSTTEFRHKSAS